MEEISLRDVITVIVKGKWLIAAVVIICLLLAGAGSVYLDNNRQAAKIYISLNFDGIGKGLNPDGTRFDSNLMKSPTVIQEALNNLQIDSSVLKSDQIRRNITIEPIVPSDVVARIETLRKDGQDFTYFPNEFVIKMNIPEGIDKSTCGQVLDAVVDAYSSYFYDTYSDRSVLANSIGKLYFEEYDYPEISTVIHNQINIIANYLAAKEAESNGFRAKQTGLAFADIQESLDIIDKVDLNRMDSIIGAYNLTKDKDKLIKSYEYRIKRNDLNKAKKTDEAAQSKDMMNSYKREQNSILIPGLTTTESGGTIQQEDSASYYDSLAARATNAGVEASNDIHDNEYLQKEIEKLLSDTVTPESKASAVKQVMDLLGNIKAKIENWIDMTNKTAAEYYDQKLNKAIMRLSPVQVQSDVNLKMNLAIAMVIGLMLGAFIAFFRDYWRNTVPVPEKEKKAVHQTGEHQPAKLIEVR